MASTPDILTKLNVGSGMNNSEIITSLVDAERTPALERIEKNENSTKNKISAYGVLKSDISAFRDIIRDIKSSNAASHVGSSSNTTIAKFSTTGTTGSDNVDSSLVVSSLATTHTLVTGAYNNSGSTVGEGSLTIDFGTWSTTSSANDTFTANSNSAITVTTSASTTLTQLRDSINNATDNAEASILYNGTGYVLVIKGESGASNEVRVTPSEGSSATLTNNFSYTASTKNLTQTVDGTDASFTVDGIAMTRSTNTISDLFNGYTLELEATSSSAINISSTQNLDNITSLLSNFIDAYNAIYTNITEMSGAAFSEDESTGPLAGDSLARSIQRELRSYTTKSLSGYEGGPYSMSLLGVQTNRDGSLTLNTSVLKNSFAAAPKIVDAIFKNQLISDNAEVEVTSIGTDTKPGSYAITKTGSDYFIDGVQMTANGTLYTSGSGDSNGMVMNIASSDVSSANIYYGKSLMTKIDASLSNFLEFNGDINNRISNLTDKLSDFKDQKTNLDKRMATLTDRYALQFSSMEQSIAGLKETGNYLDQMLKQDKD
ncbi:MAG: flagellar hook-associated protein 2 [Alphaproteobacteria bacterium]|nr:MAG: flagellar hook-associated protein 2 [Alphaproteobacteria bacterium]|tara:strand:+ start:142 stop:1779 length:1638 start_codon:yes stop_codon:yes gene_type:complete